MHQSGAPAAPERARLARWQAPAGGPCAPPAERGALVRTGAVEAGGALP